ncbi:MAG TPA: Ppx/GppA phosphatase family protein [Mycobacteriales bacterium]|jgi:exopolyphosphatase/guanosine-5'-triphosphate,3'-diphosphate pyrophosphatase|nr:Ppx/GppA phosphatase family protein [Mycobacteriales bacterium]
MTLVAAIDCGTNSLRLLIAQTGDAEPGFVELLRRVEIVRLGQGVDRTGRLADEALRRADLALAGFAEDLVEHRVELVRAVATSAMRDAENSADFLAMVRSRLGIEPEIVGGEDEARLAFRGAVHEIAGDRVFPTPHCVLDVGGGSTELIWGNSGSDIGMDLAAAVSMNVGAVRLSERYLAGEDPPTAVGLAAARRDVAAALDGIGPLPEVGTLIGVAGSVNTVAAVSLGLTEYRPELLHHVRLRAESVTEVAEQLAAQSHRERASNPAIHSGRVDVIVAGALIVDEVIRRLGCDELIVSEHDILHGIAYRALDGDA